MFAFLCRRLWLKICGTSFRNVVQKIMYNDKKRENMKTNWMVAVALIAACFTLVSCGNSKQQQAQVAEGTVVLSVDDLMAKAAGLIDQEVTLEGVCTHTCSHGAKKMFLVGSDDTKTLRIEAGELGAFDTKVVNNIVVVKGIVKEERIDEAYLQNWENSLKSETEEKHGHEARYHKAVEFLYKIYPFQSLAVFSSTYSRYAFSQQKYPPFTQKSPVDLLYHSCYTENKVLNKIGGII